MEPCTGVKKREKHQNLGKSERKRRPLTTRGKVVSGQSSCPTGTTSSGPSWTSRPASPHSPEVGLHVQLGNIFSSKQSLFPLFCSTSSVSLYSGVQSVSVSTCDHFLSSRPKCHSYTSHQPSPSQHPLCSLTAADPAVEPKWRTQQRWRARSL